MKIQDQFANVMHLTVTQSGVDTFTVGDAVQLGVGLFQNAALIIHEIEYYLGKATYQALDADGDRVNIGVVGDNTIASLQYNDPRVYDMQGWTLRLESGVGFEVLPTNFKVIRGFDKLPGGGMIVPADKIYLSCYSDGTGIANTADVRIRFTIKELKANEYLELAQSLRVFS